MMTVPSLSESYDRETARRKANRPAQTPHRPGTHDWDAVTSANGILAQLRRAANRDATPAPRPTEAFDRPNPGTGKVRMPSAARVRYVFVLLGQLRTHNPVVEATARTWVKAHEDTMTDVQVTDVIARLQAHLKASIVAPATPAPSAPRADVAEGRYALDGTEPGSVRFFRVKISKAGRSYLVEQHGDSESLVRWDAGAGAILAAIAKDAKEAMLRYGRELGHCGHCGRTLTNDESRARGIGPICAGKMGW